MRRREAWAWFGVGVLLMLGVCTVVIVEAGKVPDRQQGAGPRHQCAANITGPTTVVAGGTYSYQANASGIGGLITTTWTVTGNATITSTNVGQFVTVETGDVAGSYTLSIVVECLSQSQPFHTDTVTDSLSVFVPAPPVDPEPEPDIPCEGRLSGAGNVAVGDTVTVSFTSTSGDLQTLNFFDAGDVSITTYFFGGVIVTGDAEGERSGQCQLSRACSTGGSGTASHNIAVYAAGDPTPVPTNTPIPTNTPVPTPLPTNTPVPVPPGEPTNTPVPLPDPTEAPTEIPPTLNPSNPPIIPQPVITVVSCTEVPAESSNDRAAYFFTWVPTSLPGYVFSWEVNRAATVACQDV